MISRWHGLICFLKVVTKAKAFFLSSVRDHLSSKKGKFSEYSLLCLALPFRWGTRKMATSVSWSLKRLSNWFQRLTQAFKNKAFIHLLSSQHAQNAYCVPGTGLCTQDKWWVNTATLQVK